MVQAVAMPDQPQPHSPAPPPHAAAPVVAPAAPAAAFSSPGFSSPSAPAQEAGEADEADLRSLVDMGFGEAEARAALAQARGETDLAISILLSPHSSPLAAATPAPPLSTNTSEHPSSVTAVMYHGPAPTNHPSAMGHPSPPPPPIPSPPQQQHTRVVPVALSARPVAAPAPQPERLRSLGARLMGRGRGSRGASPVALATPMLVEEPASPPPFGSLYGGHGWDRPQASAPPSTPPPPYQPHVQYQPPPDY